MDFKAACRVRAAIFCAERAAERALGMGHPPLKSPFQLVELFASQEETGAAEAWQKERPFEVRAPLFLGAVGLGRLDLIDHRVPEGVEVIRRTSLKWYGPALSLHGNGLDEH